MRRNMPLAIGILSLAFAACGPGPRPFECATAFGPGTTGAECEGACVNLTDDPSNCGRCNTVCSVGANACVGGQCVCSNPDGSHASKVACLWPTDCDEKHGWCVTPDPAGMLCSEIDGIPCADQNRVCIAGYCTLPDCVSEEICRPGAIDCDGLCNRKDDDCDGLTDQTDIGQPLSQICESHATDGIGICRPGQQNCVAGGWTPCNGAQGPVTEVGFLRCDGLDNDCDACADNSVNDQGVCEPPPPLEADIVFIIDRSGSMGGTITAVASAVQSWATNIGTNPNIRFALVDPTALYDPDGVRVDLGLSGYMAFNALVSTLSANGSGTEPMHYATQLVMDGTFDAALGWAPDSVRIVIAIHDESTADPGYGNTVAGYDESSVCGSVPMNTVLAVITYTQWYQEWDLCTSTTSMPPSLMPLSSDPMAMLANLNLIIETPCF